MKEFWNTIQLAFAAVGGWLGYFLGGCDGLLYALLTFVVIDYITGVMCAIADKTLSSEVGFKGICRKVLIFLLVGIANVLDVQVIATGSVLRTAVIFFYISNEGVSLLENAMHLGLPVPEKIKTVLEQLPGILYQTQSKALWPKANPLRFPKITSGVLRNASWMEPISSAMCQITTKQL